MVPLYCGARAPQSKINDMQNNARAAFVWNQCLPQFRKDLNYLRIKWYDTFFSQLVSDYAVYEKLSDSTLHFVLSLTKHQFRPSLTQQNHLKINGHPEFCWRGIASQKGAPFTAKRRENMKPGEVLAG